MCDINVIIIIKTRFVTYQEQPQLKQIGFAQSNALFFNKKVFVVDSLHKQHCSKRWKVARWTDYIWKLLLSDSLQINTWKALLCFDNLVVNVLM